MVVSYPLQKFNVLEKIQKRKNPVLGFIGRRGSGKSTLMKDIMYKLRHKFHWGIVMCGTESANGYYKNFIPDAFCFDDWKPDLVIKLLNKQQKANMTGNQKRVFVIIDDNSFDKSIFRSLAMRELLMNGRHCGVTVLLSSQYLMDIECSLRSNIDFIFTLRENSVNNMKKMYDNYFGVIPKFNKYKEIMFEHTQEQSSLVVDCTAQSNNIEDVVYWYKADLHNRFYVGSPSFWLTFKAYYNPNYIKDISEEE